MLGSFKSAFEYSKFGTALDNAYSRGDALLIKLRYSDSTSYGKAQVISHGRFIQNEISTRFDKYNWPVERKIWCPRISSKMIPIILAYTTVISQLIEMAGIAGCGEEITEFL